MKTSRPLLALIAAVVLVTAAVILVLSTSSDAATPTVTTRPPGCLPYLPDRCPAEHTLPEITSTSTTSTTIDLSFLNTTTTSVPQYRNTPSNAPPPSISTSSSDRWDRLAHCETRGDWTTNTGNGFGGGVQFAHGPGWSTWRAYGGEEFAPHPWEATREQQIEIAERVLADAGWRAWPGCSRLLGFL